ncbi:PREDICTED: serine/arginine repetitive matrix protein 3 [Rhinopithecus bieti]|uniref:serine/arginine repetitive matrix protein 3 n=1 Tax=Rhinopithecus bieti TaxID=61621 RepID=UPI00083C52F7|nr:PREDICTED: serine/arginine repetitive matrix protein 3 [Rhinopithecus bieti]
MSSTVNNGAASMPSPPDAANGFPQPSASSGAWPRAEEELRTAEPGLVKRAHREILDHERKRRVELKCMELQEMMEEQGYSEEEIRQKVGTFRQMLMEKEGVLTREDRPGGHIVVETPRLTEGAEPGLEYAPFDDDDGPVDCDCPAACYRGHRGYRSAAAAAGGPVPTNTSASGPGEEKARLNLHRPECSLSHPPLSCQKEENWKSRSGRSVGTEPGWAQGQGNVCGWERFQGPFRQIGGLDPQGLHGHRQGGKLCPYRGHESTTGPSDPLGLKTIFAYNAGAFKVPSHPGSPAISTPPPPPTPPAAPRAHLLVSTAVGAPHPLRKKKKSVKKHRRDRSDSGSRRKRRHRSRSSKSKRKEKNKERKRPHTESPGRRSHRHSSGSSHSPSLSSHYSDSRSPSRLSPKHRDEGRKTGSQRSSGSRSPSPSGGSGWGSPQRNGGSGQRSGAHGGRPGSAHSPPDVRTLRFAEGSRAAGCAVRSRAGLQRGRGCLLFSFISRSSLLSGLWSAWGPGGPLCTGCLGDTQRPQASYSVLPAQPLFLLQLLEQRLLDPEPQPQPQPWPQP